MPREANIAASSAAHIPVGREGWDAVDLEQLAIAGR
jgi:hypothetical protein